MLRSPSEFLKSEAGNNFENDLFVNQAKQLSVNYIEDMQILRKRVGDVEKVCLQQREQFFEAVRDLEFSCSKRINEIKRSLIHSKNAIEDKTNFSFKKEDAFQKSNVDTSNNKF